MAHEHKAVYELVETFRCPWLYGEPLRTTLICPLDEDGQLVNPEQYPKQQRSVLQTLLLGRWPMDRPDPNWRGTPLTEATPEECALLKSVAWSFLSVEQRYRYIDEAPDLSLFQKMTLTSRWLIRPIETAVRSNGDLNANK